MARNRTCRRLDPVDSRALALLAREEAAFRLCRRALAPHHGPAEEVRDGVR